ncbi:MAG: OsmC family protein [Bacteriovoracales bacterium]
MINVKNSSNLSVEITNGEHLIKADVEKKSGGDRSAFNPHELLEASLGACTNTTLMIYSRMKNIPLRDIHTKVEVLEEGEENLILREIKLIGELDDSQRERLLKIANKCPMHNFLVKKSIIQTKVV